jgi:hypothetical protein
MARSIAVRVFRQAGHQDRQIGVSIDGLQRRAHIGSSFS